MVIKNRPRFFTIINGENSKAVLSCKNLAETLVIPAHRAISGRCRTMPISAVHIGVILPEAATNYALAAKFSRARFHENAFSDMTRGGPNLDFVDA
jgi:hypothetical protein